MGISNFTRLTALSRFTLVHGELLIMRPLGCKTIPDNGHTPDSTNTLSIEAKQIRRENVLQLTVSMGDQACVSVSIESGHFLRM